MGCEEDDWAVHHDGTKCRESNCRLTACTFQSPNIWAIDIATQQLTIVR